MALVSTDAGFSRNPVLDAKINAEKHGIEIVDEATCPLPAEDRTPRRRS
ncbi:hypothetical protein [Streptomyces sp. NRRL F-5135]|nr:hypothetical protein [Streptomyces sp. NRRL F-5135]